MKNIVLLPGVTLLLLHITSGLAFAHVSHLPGCTEEIKKTDYLSKMDNVMLDMHNEMSEISFSGNEDFYFLQMMIPHHQGAIDMARVILEKTQDKEIKNLALSIITEQENEIAIMNQLIKEKKNAN